MKNSISLVHVWTRIAVSISYDDNHYDDNHYTTSTSTNIYVPAHTRVCVCVCDFECVRVSVQV